MSKKHPTSRRPAPRLFGAAAPAASTTSPYNPPSYFPPAYFFGGAAGDEGASTSTLGKAPYNAPSYFASDYFYGGAAGIAVAPVLGKAPYNAPSYFAPAYFFGGAADTSSTPTTPVAISGRDGPCYEAIVTLLGASAAFDSVAFGDPSRAGDGGAADYPRAVVTARGWEESDDTDPALTTRRSLFSIRITVRVEDDAYPFDELDRLSAEVQARVDGSSLGGRCVPSLTKIRAGRYQAAGQYPEWSVDLDGEFTQLVDPPAP